MEYIGVHSTDNLQDGYFGSGTYLKNAFNKYGRDVFSKQIIEVFDNRISALEKEKELVNHNYVKKSSVYNLVLGGICPNGRSLSIKKFKKGERDQLLIDFNKGVEEKYKGYEISIEGDKLVFYPDKDLVCVYKEWIQLIDWNKDQLFEKQPYYKAGWLFRIIISKFIINHIEETCNILTNFYNDKRYNKQAVKLIKEMIKINWLGSYVLAKKMEIAA